MLCSSTINKVAGAIDRAIFDDRPKMETEDEDDGFLEVECECCGTDENCPDCKGTGYKPKAGDE